MNLVRDQAVPVQSGNCIELFPERSLFRRFIRRLSSQNNIIGKASLIFEEVQITLCKIEAILNLRSITLSTVPNNLAYISFGRFLISTALNNFPYSNLNNVLKNRVIHWQRVEQIQQQFWRRWSRISQFSARKIQMANQEGQFDSISLL